MFHQVIIKTIDFNMSAIPKQKSIISVWLFEFTKKNMKKLYELCDFWKFVKAIFSFLPFILFVYFIIRSCLDFQEGKTGVNQASVITVVKFHSEAIFFAFK